MSRYAYIAEPIDQAGGYTGWVSTASLAHDLLLELEVNHYSPFMAWTLPHGVASQTQITNNLALGGASVMLALLPEGVSTVGVPMEIERACSLDIPVVVWTNGERPGALLGYDIIWADSIPDAVRRTKNLLGAVSVETKTETTTTTESVDYSTLAVEWHQFSLPLDLEIEAKWDSTGGDNGAPPVGHHEGDAGYDLVVAETTQCRAGDFTMVPCHTAVQLPEGFWGMVVGRSSTWRNERLLINPGVIDNGFRGPLFTCVYNPNPRERIIQAGERLAQLIPIALAPPIRWVQGPLDDHTRGERGWGSTGS
jgi:dUTP pyrophosphatase